MRRLSIMLVLLAAAALLLSGCSSETDSTSPLAGDADKKGSQIIVGDPMLLALQGALENITDDDYVGLHITIERGCTLGLATRLVDGDVRNVGMPPVSMSLPAGYTPKGEINFTVFVPWLKNGVPWDLPGDCIPIMYSTDMDEEDLANIVLHIPYTYFDDTLVLTQEYRTFNLSQGNDGLPYPANETSYVNSDYDPLGFDEPFIASVGVVKPPSTELWRIIIDPTDPDEDEE